MLTALSLSYFSLIAVIHINTLTMDFAHKITEMMVMTGNSLTVLP